MAGLGGGMGAFLAEPLMDELRDCSRSADTSLQDVRKVLEILVPLIYRPAMKVLILHPLAYPTAADLLHIKLTMVGS